jgi:hypothetical protein
MNKNETLTDSRNPNDQMLVQLACEWRVHTYRLLKEIADHSGQPILRQPMAILGKILHQVGERAAELNDAKLNALMMRLTIYTVADPDSPDYDPALVAQIMRQANATPAMSDRITTNDD